MDETGDMSRMEIPENTQTNTLYYSQATGGFYAAETHPPESLPEDVVQITAEQHAQLLAAEAAGQQIVFDAKQGQPVAAPVTPTLDERKAIKISELTTAFNAALNAGFTSDSLGQTHRYDSEQHNRENLIGAVATGVAQLFTCDDGEDNTDSKQQRLHTPEQLKQVLIDGAARKQVLIARLRTQRAAVLAATTETQVERITWGDTTPETPTGG